MNKVQSKALNGGPCLEFAVYCRSKSWRAINGGYELFFTVNGWKMHGFAFFIQKYLRPYECRGTNFTAAVNCAKPKTERQSDIIETEIIEIPI